MTANPMQPDVQRLLDAPRCGALTRRGTACQAPAVNGKRRCRMHGGAHGSGAPRGARHGHYKHGFWTKDAVAFRADAVALIRQDRFIEEVGDE